MLTISNLISIPDEEIEISAIRAQGAGGQHVNKVSSAIHLRFDIQHSSLPQVVKQRLMQLEDQRISKKGIIIIKAQTHRSQEKNKIEALNRLQLIIQSVTITRKKRIKTKPSQASQQKRMDSKTKQGRLKRLRSNISE